MNLLATILTFLETKFSFVFTSITGILNTIVSEIPDDEIAILHGATNASLNVLKSGGTAEQAYTAGLNYFSAAEITEGNKLLTSLLQAIVTASAPSA